MSLSENAHTGLLYNLTNTYPVGAVKGMLKFAHAVVGTLNNAYRNAGQNIRLSFCQDCRKASALSVCADGKVRDFDMSLDGDLVIIGAEKARVNNANGVAALVKALYWAVEQTVASDE